MTAGTVGWPGRAELAGRARTAFTVGWGACRGLNVADVAVALAQGGAAVLLAWLSKLLIDGLGAGADGRTLWLAAGVAATTLAVAVLTQLDQYLAPLLRRAVAADVQARLYAKVNAFVGLGPLEDPRLHDRLRLAQQAGEAAPQQVISGVAGLLRGLVQLGGFVAALWVLWPPMVAATVLAAVPVVAADVRLAGGRAATQLTTSPGYRRRLFYRMLLTDRAAAMESRLFGTGTFLFDRMADATARTDRAENAHDTRVLRLRCGSAVLAGLVTGAALVFAVARAAQGRLTPGDVLLFTAAVGGVQAALLSTASVLTSTYEALLLFGSYRDVVRAPDDLPTGAAELPPLGTGIEFRDVWFRYEDGPWVLRGVTFTVPAGAAIGLVGANGAGKSTLVKLLCRFYDPQRGQIRWDGVDIRTVPPQELRARLGAVFQEFVRYDLSAAENIGLGALEHLHDRERIDAAARLAGARPFLQALPSGYDTLLSRLFFSDDQQAHGGGTNLSGGQWQRVALARSVMRTDAELLILDEPSSGLDAVAEHQVHTALREYRRGRTCLLISHRLGTLRAADRIVVLDDGRVTESGSHDALLAAGGGYARLFALQADGYRDRPADPVPA
ncbi:ABC transporter ATP-binding protein [Catellatospora sp. NPDC049609]|uniref:ABC transporter ATP-binding protein n=1 Tax=Catellatospora sp. NPDC049609 TaxID=3155505 RepID=UPI00343430A0